MTGSNRKSPSNPTVRVITRLNIGGPSIQAINLSRELNAEGFDTCLTHGDLAEGDMARLLPPGGTETVYIDDLVGPISPLRGFRAWQPEIVHTHHAKAGAVGRLAALFYNWKRRSRSYPSFDLDRLLGISAETAAGHQDLVLRAPGN